jgi:drug/metabolite transporter (DMT)-like permease
MWHPKKRWIVVIWVVVLGAAILAASIWHDNDPSTDDGAGWGAIAFIVGAIATTAYLVVSSFRHSRQKKAAEQIAEREFVED